MQLAGTHAGTRRADHAAVSDPDKLRRRHQDWREEPVAKPERPVWPMHVVVLGVDPEHWREMLPPDDQQPVQAVLPDGSNPGLREGVGVGRLERCQHHLGALGAEEVVEGAAELGIPIAEQELDPASLLAEHQQQVARLLGDPGGAWVGGQPGQVDAAGVQFDAGTARTAV
jgi:hypothetical protein